MFWWMIKGVTMVNVSLIEFHGKAFFKGLGMVILDYFRRRVERLMRFSSCEGKAHIPRASFRRVFSVFPSFKYAFFQRSGSQPSFWNLREGKI
jgi:hypothetical protein